MALTNIIQCYAYGLFDLYVAIASGQVTISTEGLLLLLDYEVDGLNVTDVISDSTDPVNPIAGVLYQNTTTQEILVCIDGENCVLVGKILGRDGVNVISKDLLDLPESPSDGDQYIVSASTSTLIVNKNNLARYSGGEWKYAIPEVNEIVGVTDTLLNYKWNGSLWVKALIPWVTALPPENYVPIEDGVVQYVTFGTNPGVVSSSSSGVPGIEILTARSDHSHDLGPHAHEDNDNGGQISLADILNKTHTSLTDIGTNTHAQIDTYFTDHDHNGINSKEIATLDGGSFI